MKHSNEFKTTSWPMDVVTLLCGLAALLIYFQYHTLDKFRVLKPDVRYGTFDGFRTIVNQYVQLDLLDGLLAGLILAVCALIVVLEGTRQRLTQFLDHVFQSDRFTLILLSSASLILVRFYFARGEFSWAADTYLHASYAWITAQSFAVGEIPIWTNYFCAGTPYLQFYGFLFYYTVGLVSLALQDAMFATKVVLATAHVASGVGMYLFVRTLSDSRRLGFLSGIAYVATFWHTQHVLILGRLPVSLPYALLPFSFFFLEKSLRSRRKLSCAVGGALTLGALGWAHPGYAFWSTGFLVLYGMVRIWNLPSEERKPALVSGVLMVGGSVLLSASLTVPMYLERGNTGLHAGFYMSEFPVPTWSHLLWWSNYRFRIPHALDHWYGGYIGVSLSLLAILGAIQVLRQRGRVPAWLPGAVCLFGALILVFGYRWPVLGALAVVQAMSASRYLLYVVFFVCLMAGLGARAICDRLARRSTYAIILLVLVADLGSTTFQHPYRSAGVEQRIGSDQLGAIQRDPNGWARVKPLPLQHEPVYARLKAEAAALEPGQFPGYRVFHTTNRIYYHFLIPWLAADIGVPTPLDTFTQYPLTIPAFIRRFQDLFHASTRGLGGRELESAPRFDLIRSGLFLLNTRHVFHSPSETESIRHWELSEASPIVVSSKIRPLAYPVKELDRSRARSLPGEWDEGKAREDAERARNDFVALLETMDVDPESGTCRQILLREGYPAADLGSSPSAEVLRHQVWGQKVRLEVAVSAPCYARLAYTYYPHQRVWVDGDPAERMVTAGHFIALKLSGGKHVIELEPRLSPLRFWLMIVSGLVICLGIIVVSVEFRRSGEEGEALPC